MLSAVEVSRGITVIYPLCFMDEIRQFECFWQKRIEN